MDPSQVRERILADHVAIREQIQQIELLTEEVAFGGDPAPLRDACSALMFCLLDHMDLEDRLLAPALREADAWGEVRADELEAHHQHQRREFRKVLDRLDDGLTDAPSVAATVQGLLLDLREEMEREERDLLDPDVLRDDVIAIDHVGA